jgi:hypothetical protein
VRDVLADDAGKIRRHPRRAGRGSGPPEGGDPAAPRPPGPAPRTSRADRLAAPEARTRRRRPRPCTACSSSASSKPSPCGFRQLPHRARQIWPWGAVKVSCSRSTTRLGAARLGGRGGPRQCLIIDLVVGRGELTDAAWERIAPLLPGVDGRGRPWRDHRQVINGVL